MIIFCMVRRRYRYLRCLASSSADVAVRASCRWSPFKFISYWQQSCDGIKQALAISLPTLTIAASSLIPPVSSSLPFAKYSGLFSIIQQHDYCPTHRQPVLRPNRQQSNLYSPVRQSDLCSTVREFEWKTLFQDGFVLKQTVSGVHCFPSRIVRPRTDHPHAKQRRGCAWS